MEQAYDMQSILQQYEDMVGMSLIASLASEIPTMLINLAIYVFTALALYTIAKRRGIHRPWLAWIPFANSWLLGCVSDQYRAVARGETKYRRRWLLWTEILSSVFAVLMLALVFGMLFDMLSFSMGNLENLDHMSEAMQAELLGAIMGPAVGVILLLLVMMPVAIVGMVFSFIALHDIYKSCDPNNATLYLVLSIFIGYARPILLFLSRNKDLGMPVPVAPQPMYTDYQPVYEQPATPPVEPWEQKEE